MEFRGHRGRFWISVILIVLVADLALGGFHANGLLLDVVLLVGWWATRQTAVRTVGPWLVVSFWPATRLGFKVHLADVESVETHERVPFSWRMNADRRLAIFVTQRRQVLEIHIAERMSLLVTLDDPAAATEAILSAASEAPPSDHVPGKSALRAAFRGVR
ncbi:MAG TPA: hypothetical protein VIT24_00125 [Acidimicrobiales bacterium]|jgi:hypothetical protein